MDFATKLKHIGSLIPVRRALIAFIVFVSMAFGAFPLTNVNGQGNTLNPPTIAKFFDNITAPGIDTIHAGKSAVLAFTLNNPNTGAGETLTGVNFVDNLPPGVFFTASPATPIAATTTCTGNFSATNTGSTGLLSVDQVSIPPNSACRIEYLVTAVRGFYNNRTSAINAQNAQNSNNIGQAILNVLDLLQPPTIAKSFNLPTVAPNGASIVTIDIQNPNNANGSPLDDLTQVNLTDVLPASLTVTGPATANANCAVGTIGMTGNTLNVTNVTIRAGQICTVTIPVTAPNTTGVITNTILPANVTFDGGVYSATVNADLNVVVPLTASKVFGGTFTAGGTTTLTFTLTNPAGNSGQHSNIQLDDNLPAGLIIADSNVTATPNGCLTASPVPGAGSVAVTGGPIAVGATCSITVNVTSSASGNYDNNAWQVRSTINGQTVPAVTPPASVTVLGPNPAPLTLTKNFAATPINNGDHTRTTFTVHNPNAITVFGVAFTDPLPGGLIVTSPNNLSSTGCGAGATISALPAATTISLSGGLIPAGGDCVITVDVTGVTGGNYTNTTSPVTAFNAPAGLPGTAILAVNNVGPGTAPTISKVFGGALSAGGITTLQITVTNPNAGFPLFGVNFTDTLPTIVAAPADGRMRVANPPNASLTGAGCTGNITAAVDTQIVSLSNGVIPAGGSCVITVNVTSSAAGNFTNQTGPVSSTNVPGNNTSIPVPITVNGPSILPPNISKAFGVPSIAVGTTTTLTFTITNPNGGTALTNVQFADTFPNGIRVAPAPNVGGSCPGTLNAGAGSQSIDGQINTLGAGASCTFTVDVVGANPGAFTNQSGPVRSDNGGDNLPNPATAPIRVEGPPTVNKSFAPNTVQVGGSVTLTITITNPSANPDALTNVSLADILPNLGTTPISLSQMVASNLQIVSGCGVGATFTSSTAGNGVVTLNFANGTIAPNTDCVLTTTVAAPAVGSYVNQTQPVSTGNGGNGGSSNRTTLSATGLQQNLQVSKSFNPTTLRINEISRMTIQITNPDPQQQTGVRFTDTLPSGLIFAIGAGEPNEVGNCNGGTIAVDTIAQSIALNNGTLGASGSPTATCSILIDVTSPTANANYSNTVSVTSLQVNTPTTASASLTFIGPPTVTKAIAPNPIAPGQSATLTLVVSNPNRLTALTGLTLTDLLPAGMGVVSLGTVPNSCGAGPNLSYTTTQVNGRTQINFSGGSVNAGVGVTCTLTAQVTALPGTYTNTIRPGDVTTSNAGNNPPPAVSANLTVLGFSIGNRVWFDTNDDGRQNNGESGAANVSVTLYPASGSTISGPAVATTTTDASGYYRFDGIPAGTYIVAVDRSNWQGGGPLVGYASSTNNITQTGPTTPDAFDNGIDNSTPASSPNGILSTPITIGLNQQPLGEDQTAPQPGHTATYQNNGLAGDAGDAYNNLTVDFGFYRLTLNGIVWNDSGAGANFNNGRLDAGEMGIANVIVQLLKGGTLVAQTTTNAAGQYRFDQQTTATGVPTGNPLVAGNDYMIRIVRGQAPLANFVSSTDLATTFNPTNNGNGVPLDDNGLGGASANTNDTVTDTFTLNVFGKTNTAGSVLADAARAVTNQPTIDFGFHPQSNATFSVGNRVWLDNGAGGGTANNGIQDGSEPGINGVRVLLYAVDTNNQPTTLINTATTSGGGYYRFDGVPAGNYVVILDTVNSPLSGLIVSNNTFTDFTTSGDQRNKGQQTPLPAGSVVPGGIVSGVFTLATGTPPLNEPDVDLTGANPPAAHGPNGDASDQLTVDFGLYRPNATTFSVGNRVWLDNGAGGVLGSANNGIQDGSEPGIANVSVRLYAADNANNPIGNALQTVTTDGQGYYRFDNVAPGNYIVVVDQPGSAALTGLTVSAVTSTDFTTPGDQRNKGQQTPLPAGSVLPGGIRSSVITIPPTAPVTLEPDVTGAGFGAHGPNGDANDILTADFGFFQNPATAFSIGNRVWLDNGAGGGTANDGIQNGGETGLQGVTMRLFNANSSGTPIGLPLQSTVTDANGYYRFDGINPGTYVVVMDLPTLNSGPNKYQLTPVSFTDVTTIGGDRQNKGIQTPLGTGTPLPGGIVSPPITIPVGGTLLTGEPDLGAGAGGHGPGGDNRDNLLFDFGLVPIAPNSFSIGNRVWLDNGAGGGTANDGIQNGTEPGIPGVVVVLVQADNAGNLTTVLQTVTTDSSGYYRFDNVVPGNYVVVVNQPGSPPLTGLNVSAVTSTDFTTPGDQRNKGQQTPLPGPIVPGGIRSGLITIPPTPLVLNEPDVTGTGFGAHGPNGDGNDILTADFGFTVNPAQALSIGNRVWFDNGLGGGTANDGIQNGAEPGIPNVTVRLFFSDSAGNPQGSTPIASATTDANGYYRFDGLIPGTYVVIVDKPASPTLNGFLPSSVTSTDFTTAGDQRNKGQSIPLPQGTVLPGGIISGPVVLATPPLPTGEPDVATGAGGHGPNGDALDNLTVDFGFVAGPSTYSIGNRVWNDINDDGTQQSNEPPIAGVQVILFQADATGNPTTVVGRVTTDSQGFYRFDGLAAGNYVVIVDVANSPVLNGSRLSSVTPGNPQTNTTDALNNGQQTLLPAGSVVPGGVRSGLISLGARPSEPIGEVVPTSYGPGSVFTLNNAPEASDDRGNLTIDFGFVLPPRSNPAQFAAPILEDPGISKSGDPSLAGVGEIVTWTITVTNPNNVALTDIMVADTVPGELEILSVVVANGQSGVSGQSVSINISRLEPKQSENIFIRTRVRQGADGEITNIAELLGRYKGKGRATVRLIRKLPATGEHPDSTGVLDMHWVWAVVVAVLVLGVSALRRHIA